MHRRLTRAQENALERRREQLEQLRRLGSISWPIKYHVALRGRIGPKAATVWPEFYYYDNRSRQYTAEFLPAGSVRERAARWLVCRWRGAAMKEIR